MRGRFGRKSWRNTVYDKIGKDGERTDHGANHEFASPNGRNDLFYIDRFRRILSHLSRAYPASITQTAMRTLAGTR